MSFNIYELISLANNYPPSLRSKIKARIMFCFKAHIIEHHYESDSNDDSCMDKEGLTKCMSKYLSTINANKLTFSLKRSKRMEYNPKTGEMKEIIDYSNWKQLALNFIYEGDETILSCVEKYNCFAYFGMNFERFTA